MKEFSQNNIVAGIDFVCVSADRFKTNEIAVDFSLELKKETAALNAMTVSLLSDCSRKYPDMLELNKKLAHLYGASLCASVQKIGETQDLRISLSSLDDRFSLGGKISRESVELLLSLVFDPRLDENGNFFEEDIQREKRLLKEKIQSEENEKRLYALSRLQKLMFDGEPFGIGKYGEIEDIDPLGAADVKSAWQNMLSCAKIRVTLVGSADEAEIVQMLKDAFGKIERHYSPLKKAVFVPTAKQTKTHCERVSVKQGKLVLGFRVNMLPEDKNTSAMRAFCDVFGGGPYSKLFANVREKLSLCYYCSARYDRRKSAVFVQCGCEEENMDKAVAEILNQLEILKSGDFDEELAASKISLCDMINSLSDDSVMLMSWYANQITDSQTKSPSQSAEENRVAAKEDVCTCASLLTLDTVYKLCSVQEESK